MCRKGGISVLFLMVMCFILALSAAPAAMAHPTSSKVLRFTVVKRTAHFIIVKRHSHRYAIRRGSHEVTLKNAKHPSYRVVRRMRHYIFLRPISQPPVRVPAPDIISPTGGSFTQGTSTTITWKMSAPVSTGSFAVSLTSTLSGASTQLNADSLATLPDVTSYSMPWDVTQAAGTYRLCVSYSRKGRTVASSGVADDTIVITAESTPTPTPTPTVTPTPTPKPTGIVHPSLILNAADISAIRARIDTGQEPESSAWQYFKAYYINGPMSDSPHVIAGPVTDFASSGLEQALGGDGAKSRNLAIAYALSGDQKYAVKAHDYLVAWATQNTPTTYQQCNDKACGYHQAYGAFSFAYAYDLTYDSGAYSSADRAAIKSWFVRFADAIQTANDVYANDWWIGQPDKTKPYEWDPTKFYHPRDTYVGSDAVALSQCARLAMAHVVGYTAVENNILNDSTNVLNLQNELKSALTPKNDGDGIPGHPDPAPHVFVYGNPTSGASCIDYMTYNVRALDVLVSMAKHIGWDASKVADARQKLLASWNYLGDFFGPNAAAPFNGQDHINLDASLPRFALAYREFGGTRFLNILESGDRSQYSEPQLLGPVTLTLSIPES